MSDKKSLGSSPIGYSTTGVNSYHFIPDLGVSVKGESEEEASASPYHQQKADAEDKPYNGSGGSSRKKGNKKDEDDSPEKKIVSYYLEKGLVERLKALADDKGVYYSTLVNDAIRAWVEVHGY